MTQEQNTQNKDQTSNYGKLNNGITSTRQKCLLFLRPEYRNSRSLMRKWSSSSRFPSTKPTCSTIRKTKSQRKATLCWDCKNACGGCSWSRSFVPVKGWDAKETSLKSAEGDIKSYFVTMCPEFING